MDLHHVKEAYAKHTYLIDHLGQSSLQYKCRLKLYYSRHTEMGGAAVAIEPGRRWNMIGATWKNTQLLAPSEEAESLGQNSPNVELSNCNTEESIFCQMSY